MRPVWRAGDTRTSSSRRGLAASLLFTGAGVWMDDPKLVKVEIRCRGCGETSGWCVRIARNVPEPLRCSGGGGVGPSQVSCRGCGRRCFDTIRDLERAVGESTIGGWGRHIQAGAVILSC